MGLGDLGDLVHDLGEPGGCPVFGVGAGLEFSQPVGQGWLGLVLGAAVVEGDCDDGFMEFPQLLEGCLDWSGRAGGDGCLQAFCGSLGPWPEVFLADYPHGRSDAVGAGVHVGDEVVGLTAGVGGDAGRGGYGDEFQGGG